MTPGRWPEDLRPKALTRAEETAWREALRDAPTLYALKPEDASLVTVTIAEWADRMRRVFATLDEARSDGR